MGCRSLRPSSVSLRPALHYITLPPGVETGVFVSSLLGRFEPLVDHETTEPHGVRRALSFPADPWLLGTVHRTR